MNQYLDSYPFQNNHDLAPRLLLSIHNAQSRWLYTCYIYVTHGTQSMTRLHAETDGINSPLTLNKTQTYVIQFQ